MEAHLNVLAAIAKDNPRRITHRKLIVQLLDLKTKGLVDFKQQVLDGQVVALYDFKLSKLKEVPLATIEDFYMSRTQELL